MKLHLALLLLSILSVACSRSGGPKTPPFSDPIIIDNPAAKVTTLPLNAGQYLVERPGSNGHDWTIQQHTRPTVIRMFQNNTPFQKLHELNTVPVTIEFDRFESPGNRPKLGKMVISWRRVGNSGEVILNNLEDSSGGPHKLHWEKRSASDVELFPIGGEPYRIRLATFHTSGGQRQCLPEDCQPITGDPGVRIAEGVHGIV